MKAIRMQEFGGPEGLPLSEARKAHEMSETHHMQSKIVLRVALEPRERLR